MSALREIPLHLIDDGTNVRSEVDNGLVTSIRTHGVLQPITVRKAGHRYDVVMGHRRVAAARVVGIETIPAVVETREPDGEVLRQVAENLHRQGMNAIDIARALQAHLDAHPEMGKAELAASLGYSGRAGAVWIANKLALLRMGDHVIDKIEAGEISEGQAIRARQTLGDGRGRPRSIPLPSEEGRSKSVSVPIGRDAASKAQGVAEVSVDLEVRHVDVALHFGDRGMFLTLTADEARLFGRRLQQAGEALQVAVAV